MFNKHSSVSEVLSMILNCYNIYCFRMFINLENSYIIVDKKLLISMSGIPSFQPILMSRRKTFQRLKRIPYPVCLTFRIFRSELL